LGQIVFAAADSITLYGESFREHAIHAGIPSRKIRITPTGIDRVHLHGKDVRRELGMRVNEILVLYVGLTVPRKGVDTLLEVAERLKGKGFVFVVVGDGPKREEYAKRAKEKGLRVIFTNTRDDVHRFYACADIFLFPSRGEGLAGVLMEAMLHHVPIVASDITGNRDLIKNNKTGVLCRPEDARAFARAIETLSRSRTERKKLASAAYDHLRDFSWSKRLHAFEEVLR
jgi:glycosyltransferase involved in cell wall biosynthesis